MNERRSARRTRETAASYGAPRLTERDLAQITRRLVRAAHPKLIIWFGSRVYGNPRPDSDLDLLVVMDRQGSDAERTSPFKGLFPESPVPVDIQARTPAEVKRRLEMGDEFMQTVVERGQQVYPVGSRNGFVRDIRTALKRGRTQPMNNAPLVHEWVEKAESDFQGAKMWSRQKKHFSPDKLCWDCQQCVEKYLKAFLTRHRVPFERIHNLDELHALCLPVDPDFRLIKGALDKADICQPKIRYPGNSVSEQDARDAFAATKELRKFIRAKLGLR